MSGFNPHESIRHAQIHIRYAHTDTLKADFGISKIQFATLRIFLSWPKFRMNMNSFKMIQRKMFEFIFKIPQKRFFIL